MGDALNKTLHKVYLIGAGPGDSDLITVKGAKILQQSDVVIYDYLVNLDILKKYANPKSELICADSLTLKRYSNGFSKRQDLINKLIIKKVKEGKKVVRLKNGDPFIFGRANEELKSLLDNKIKFVVIPGVTAATGASCFSGIPLTSRDVSLSVVFITGHQATERDMNWEAISKIDTIVIYMGAENLKDIFDKLIKSGIDSNKPVAIISNATKINQNIIISSLKKIDRIKAESPAIIIIGDVVKKEKYFNWFKKSKKILFTGLSEERFFEDGIYFHIPFIEIKPLSDYSNLKNILKEIETYDWIVFLSRYGVYYFFENLLNFGFDARILKNVKIAAIGSSTANRLKDYGILSDIKPEFETSLGLFEVLKDKIKNKKILLLRSDIADKGLEEKFKSAGAKVKRCVLYKNVIPKNIPELDLSIFDEIMFTSPSTVRNFYKIYKSIPSKIKVKCIGEVTYKEAKKYGFV